MNEKEIRKIIDDSYDESREDTYVSMVRDFYSRKMWSTAIFIWVWGMLFFAGAAYCAFKFSNANQTKSQIMYAAIFICFVQGISVMKNFAFQMIHRHSIKREIKRLELRIAELNETVKTNR
jgi:hypothetical protein